MVTWPTRLQDLASPRPRVLTEQVRMSLKGLRVKQRQSLESLGPRPSSVGVS